MKPFFRKSCFFAFAACLFFQLAPDRAQIAQAQIKTTHVAGAVHMLTGRGGNIGVSAGEDGILMVDDKFAPLAPKIKAALGGLGAKKPLAFVVNTHWHGDHTGANEIFGKDAYIISHANVRKRLAVTSYVLGRTVKPKAKVGLPVITYEGSISVHFNGEEIRIVHYPNGHTDGDSVLFFPKSNVVHTGDLFFSGRFPFVDLGNGGDVKGLTKNIAKLIGQIPKDAKIIPGHGPLSGVKELKAYHAMLVETTRIVREQMKAGKTLAQIQAAGLPQKYASWGKGFISTKRWVGTVFNSLGGKK